MSSFYDDASLVMIPSGYKNAKIYCEKPTDGSGDLTFTRASSATRVASNGLIEKVRTNLFTYSEQLDNAAWVKNVTTITANAIVAPDGTTTADKMADSDTTTAARYTYQSPASSGTIYTSSGYFKKGEYNFVTLHAFGLNGAVFNLNTGVKVSQSGGVGSIESVGNGWYRCSFTFTAGGSSVFFSQSPAGNISYAGTTGSGIYAWGLQVETGDIATQYIATTSAAVSVGPVSGLPRLDYLNSTCPRLLLEPQRTNLVTFSEQFDSWAKSNVAISANTTVSPDGYQNADTFTPTVASAGSNIFLNITTGAVATTMSAYARVASGTKSFRFYRFNATDGVVSSPTFTATTTWQRFTWTTTPTVATSSWNISNAAADLVPFIIFGAQVEVGAYATSYIPTLSTSVTRVADLVSKTSISSLIGQTEGTLFLNFRYEVDQLSRFTISDGTGNNWIFFSYPEAAGQTRVRIAASGVQQVNTTASSVFTANQTYKVALAYKSGSWALYINGTSVLSGTQTFTFNNTLSTFLLCGAFSATNPEAIYSKINETLLFKTRLTNAQLAELTTI